MKLVADAGATKINWAIKFNEDVVQFNSSGYNPNVSDSNYLRQVLITAFPKEFNDTDIEEIIYYGTGCGSDFGKERVRKALTSFFQKARVIVLTDLEGAAFSVLGSMKGLVGILGTGANAGYYNGEHISETPPSLGYLLGDEGSGAYLGKKLIAKIIRSEFSTELVNNFYKKYNILKEELVPKIYTHAKVNQYLASFVPFLKENIDHPEFEELVKNAFRKYYDKYLKQIAATNNANDIVLIGGVAKAFEKQLGQVLNEESIKLKVVESPINELLKRL